MALRRLFFAPARQICLAKHWTPMSNALIATHRGKQMGAQALHPVFAGILADITAQPEQIKRAGYIAALRCHDWSFEFSDDGMVYRAGLSSLRRLEAMRAELDPTGEVWNREAPEGFKLAAADVLAQRYGVRA